MSNRDGSKAGRKRLLDQAPARIRKFRSISPAAITPSTPAAAGPSALSHASTGSTAVNPTGAGSPTPNLVHASATTARQLTATSTLAHPVPTLITPPRTLTTLEIRERTANLLKERLTPEEAGKLNWDETTPEQAKAVVEEVQKSLEGKPEHTGKMYKTLQYINNYSKIIDVAIQHQPCITALVWAGMRTVIQVCG